MTQTFVGIDATTDNSGNVRVRRIQLDNRWLPVGQGRQWLDDDGRHVMVMLPSQEARELILRIDSLRWELKPKRTFSKQLV